MPRNASRGGRRSRAQDGEDAIGGMRCTTTPAANHLHTVSGRIPGRRAAACVQPVLETDLVERLLRSFGVDRTPSYLGDVQILGLRRIT